MVLNQIGKILRMVFTSSTSVMWHNPQGPSLASHAPVLLSMVLLNGIAALLRNLYRRFANSSCGKSFFEVSLDFFSNQFRTVAYWDYLWITARPFVYLWWGDQAKVYSGYLTETGWFVEAEPASLDVLHLGSHETEKDLMWADWEVIVSQLQQQKLVQYGWMGCLELHDVDRRSNHWRVQRFQAPWHPLQHHIPTPSLPCPLQRPTLQYWRKYQCSWPRKTSWSSLTASFSPLDLFHQTGQLQATKCKTHIQLCQEQLHIVLLEGTLLAGS